MKNNNYPDEKRKRKLLPCLLFFINMGYELLSRRFILEMSDIVTPLCFKRGSYIHSSVETARGYFLSCASDTTSLPAAGCVHNEVFWVTFSSFSHSRYNIWLQLRMNPEEPSICNESLGVLSQSACLSGTPTYAQEEGVMVIE